jgi:hypothetical protein
MRVETLDTIGYLQSCHQVPIIHLLVKKLRGFGPLANYADRPSDRRLLAKQCQLLRIEGVAWSAQRIPPVVSLGFIDRSRYYFFQVAPQLSS